MCWHRWERLSPWEYVCRECSTSLPIYKANFRCYKCGAVKERFSPPDFLRRNDYKG